MGTVKYTGPVASFHCPTNAEIRSLKVHFSPKQEGSGDPSPENVRPIVGWDGVVVHNDDGNIVPEEYQKVEYLESTGTQYLISNIPVQSPIKIETDITFTTATGDFATCCTGYETEDGKVRIGGCGYYNGKIQCYYGNYYLAQTLLENNKYRIKYTATEGNQTIELNGMVVSQTTYSHTAAMLPIDNTKINFYIFAEGRIKSDGTTNVLFYNKSKIYSLKIGNNTMTLGNFIPCRRKSDDKPGMYDTITQTFFTNQGTGEFICGPDVGQTIEYEFGVLGKNKFPSPTGDKSDCYLRKDVQYTFSATSTSAGYFKGWYENGIDTGIVWINAGSDGDRRWKTYTPTKDIVSGLFYVGQGMSECQIELGSSPTAYEPYNPNHTVYGGWVDLITGEVCEEWSKIVYDGTIQPSYFPWGSAQSGYVTALFKETDPVHYAGSEAAKRCICDKAVYSNINYLGNRTYPAVGYYFVTGTYSFGFNFPDVAGTTKESLSAYLAENPYTVIYYLNTPNTYHLAPTQLQTFLGQNNVWSNADYVEVEYDLHETQTLLQRKAFIIANQPHIESASGTIASFSTDLKAPLMECKAYFSPIQEGSGDPSPDNVRPITGRTNLGLMHRNGLPSEYQAVEYLQSTGTQFITGYFTPPTAGVITLKVILEPNSMTSNLWYCGGRSNGHLSMQVGRYAGTWYKDNSSDIYKVISVTNDIEKIFCSKSSNNTSSSYDYLLFGRAWNGSSPYSCKIFQCTLYFNDTPIYNYIPCYRKMDNVAGMYDTVNNVFYINEGAGTFTTGQDIQALPQPLLFESTNSFDWGSTFGTVYGGYVDLVKGELVEEWHKIIADGVNVKANRKYKNDNAQAYGGGIVYLSPNGVGGAYNSFVDNLPIGSLNVPCVETRAIGATYAVFYLFPYSDFEDEPSDQDIINMTNAWLQEHPTTIVYKLATPIVYSLTPQQLSTLRGQNNIWSNANGNIKLKYWSH